MLRVLLSLIFALAITIGTIWINPTTDERTMYGHEGPVEQNWLPREVAVGACNRSGVCLQTEPFFARII